MNTHTQPRAAGEDAHTMPPLSPRRPDDERHPDGYLESDRDFVSHNAEWLQWCEANDAFIRRACNSHASLTADVKRLSYALDQIGFMLAGTQFDGASKMILRVLRGEHLDDIRRAALASTNTEDKQ